MRHKQRMASAKRLQIFERLEDRVPLAADIVENFEDGTATDTFDYSLQNANEQIISGVSHGTGNKSYEILYNGNETSGYLNRYPVQFQSLKVSYWQQYPDGTTFPGAHAPGGAIKQSRLFNPNGAGPNDLGLNVQINWSEIDSDYYYTIDGFKLANGDLVDRAFYHFNLPTDEWFQTSYELKVNTVGQTDGYFKFWHNGQLILDLPNIVILQAGGEAPTGIWVGGNSNYTSADAHKPWTNFRRWIDDVQIDFDPVDTPSLPVVSVNNVVVREGNPGGPRSYAHFTISAESTGSFRPVIVQYRTRDRTAVAGEDYTARTGGVRLTNSRPTAIVRVPIIRDREVEPKEKFVLRLIGAARATISDNLGVAIIRNDDQQGAANQSETQAEAPAVGIQLLGLGPLAAQRQLPTNSVDASAAKDAIFAEVSSNVTTAQREPHWELLVHRHSEIALDERYYANLATSSNDDDGIVEDCPL